MKQPFFSLVIPAYNRANDLAFALYCALQQTYPDFEIIVCDNASSVNLEKITVQYNDPRIKYVRNTKNVGWIKNVEKGISMAAGKYIVLHGSDDFIFEADFLQELHALLFKKAYGYVRVGYLSLSLNGNRIVDFAQNPKKDFILHDKSSDEEISRFIIKSDPRFISGIVFSREDVSQYCIINSEFAPWFLVLLNAARKQGAYYFAKPQFLTTWSQNSKHPYNYLIDGRYTFEPYFEEIAKVFTSLAYRRFLYDEMRGVVYAFPLTKYRTNTRTLINCAKRVLVLSPEYKSSFSFWILLMISAAMPKFIIGVVRAYSLQKMFHKNQVRNKVYYQKLNQLRKDYTSSYL